MVSINFIAEPCRPLEEIARHVVLAKASGLPYLTESARPPLIVLGGGHSIKAAEEELRAWTGDIWAIGSVFQWCRQRGIDATFFAVDPLDEVAAMAEGATKALLAETVSPVVIAALRGAKVELFALTETMDRTNHGTTAATCTPQIAIEAGYRDVTYIGCESSFEECFATLENPADSVFFSGTSHAYKNYGAVDGGHMLIRVKVGNQAFITIPAFLDQAEYLARMLRISPLFKERGGGLLRALIKDLKVDITHGSQFMYDKIISNLAAKNAAAQVNL